MSIVGGIFLIAAIVLFFVRRSQQAKLMTVQTAEPATVGHLMQTAEAIAQDIGRGNWREQVKMSGTIRCDRPLQSELKQEDCVYYSMRVQREYEEWVTTTNSEGKQERKLEKKSDTVASNTRSTPFFLNDGTGEIEVIPDGANIETISILDEFQPVRSGSTTISYGRFSRSRSNDSSTLGYRYQESILPLDRRIFVVAMATDSSETLTLRKPLNGRYKFLISLQDEEILIQSTKGAIKALWVALWITGVLGVLLIVIGIFAS